MGPVAAYTARMFASLATAYYSSLRRTLEVQGKTEIDLLAEIQQDEAKRAALTRLMFAASQSAEQTQVEIIAHATALLGSADSRRSVALQELGTIVSQISTLQLDVLKFISSFPLKEADQGVTPDHLIERFSLESPVLRRAVRNLELNGLIADEARLDASTRGVYWKTTELGRWLLALWAEALDPKTRTAGMPNQK
jgi:DNA-binding MarR family transcriptional regulator